MNGNPRLALECLGFLTQGIEHELEGLAVLESELLRSSQRSTQYAVRGTKRTAVTITRDIGAAKGDPTQLESGSDRPGADAASSGELPDHQRLGLRDGLPGLQDLMSRLLGPDGCPWDREQSLETLKPYLLEEAHEVLEAMEDPVAHREELGDLLFQIVFQSALRAQEGGFDLDDVIAAIRAKMIRRHPHVFAGTGASDLSADAVAQQWESIKRRERAGDGNIPNPLRGLPAGLPALVRASRLQQKAATVGFDWPDIEGALAKWEEEWAEFEEARTSGDPDAMRDEFGDLLFVLVRIGQKLNLDAEDALRRANAKFETRFAHVMRKCHEAGSDPGTVGLSQLDAYWQDAKRGEHRSDPTEG